MFVVLLVVASGCDLPKVLTRVSYAQVGADGIALSFYPRSNQDSGEPGHEDFFSAVGSVVLPLVGLFF